MQECLFDKDCDEKKFSQRLRDRPNGSKTVLVGSACLSKRHLGDGKVKYALVPTALQKQPSAYKMSLDRKSLCLMAIRSLEGFINTKDMNLLNGNNDHKS